MDQLARARGRLNALIDYVDEALAIERARIGLNFDLVYINPLGHRVTIAVDTLSLIHI